MCSGVGSLRTFARSRVCLVTTFVFPRRTPRYVLRLQRRMLYADSASSADNLATSGCVGGSVRTSTLGTPEDWRRNELVERGSGTRGVAARRLMDVFRHGAGRHLDSKRSGLGGS